jgi:hypothetical protein
MTPLERFAPESPSVPDQIKAMAKWLAGRPFLDHIVLWPHDHGLAGPASYRLSLKGQP